MLYIPEYTECSDFKQWIRHLSETNRWNPRNEFLTQCHQKLLFLILFNMYLVISLSRSDSAEPHSPSDLLPMSPSVYAVLRENLSPTTIETAVCSLSFPLLVKGTPHEANVVPVNQRGWSSAWEVRKHFCWTKSMSITLGVSVCSCGSLVWALKTDIFTIWTA